ncbi:MAG TPA: hypothetical protein PLS50_08930, partial [Candidatus Dojkabacteria bacterium]|nr:hypothetical protein [Candidatus Dojkabacteria bacterium]
KKVVICERQTLVWYSLNFNYAEAARQTGTSRARARYDHYLVCFFFSFSGIGPSDSATTISIQTQMGDLGDVFL